MSKVSLRERLRRVTECGVLSQSLEALLEALVQAVEPKDIDATIRKRREVCNHQLRKELAEAKAKIERLRQHIHYLKEDVEIGKLVRGMRPWSRLVRGWAADTFWVDVMKPADILSDWGPIPEILDNPIEVLRTIQKDIEK